MNKIFRNNRRGFLSNLQIAIIAIVTILIFSVFLYQLYISLSNKMSVDSCRNSIAAHSLISTGTAREIFTDIKCPTKDIIVKDKDPEKIKKTIAEDMHRCWYVWGQGAGQYFEGDGNFCFICSTYTFKDNETQIDGLVQYLSNTNIKVTYPGDSTGITYSDYLKGRKTADPNGRINRKMEDLTQDDTFNTSQQYATIFVYASGKEAIQKTLEGGGRTTIGLVGLGGVMTGSLGIAAGIFIASNPVGWIIGGAAAVGLGVATIIESTNVKNPATLQFVAFRPYNAEELKNLQCDKIEVNQKSSKGN